MIITHNGASDLKSLDSLSAKRIWVQKSSSYYESLQHLNHELEKKELPPIYIELLPNYLQSGDILDMVNEGIIPMTVADSHLAELWRKVLPDIKVHPHLAIATNRNIGWAFRKGSPELANAINHFLKSHRKGTRFGNIVYGRYLKHSGWLRRLQKADQQHLFRSFGPIFQKYADTYEMDWLLLTAQAFQESGLNQNKRSNRGAIGIMQVLPSTAREPYVNIPHIEQLENNVHAGTKYLRFMIDNFFNQEQMTPRNRYLFALAAYNAGPNRISRVRALATKHGFDENIWFNNVEVVAARYISDETIRYVSNISKYYLAYRYIWNVETSRKKMKEQLDRHHQKRPPLK
ncbi:MltF family protein [Dongshaea marina]|uniref:transglycosylase SLT domain-containing protein n=1 Tax=Dongshaea marina TaxID=2047966 RepID=UPI000D3E921B|nr:transglycosylase SLT domain-containing protein [Dongshaea marina]